MATEYARFETDDFGSAKVTTPLNRVREILGLRSGKVPESYEAWGRIIHGGFPASSFARVSRTINIAAKELAPLMHISVRTVDRWRVEKKHLSPEASDRLFRIVRIAAHAEEVFGDKENAHLWLREPNIALNDKRPIDILDTDIGASAVDDVLTRIEYGIY